MQVEPIIVVKKNHGQIVVEYILLLIVGVSIAILLMNMIVSRNPESPGFLVLKWNAILEVIGQDQQ